jgi:hypothetical protein
MGADRFVEPVAGHTELLRPVCDVGGHLRVDLPNVVRTFNVVSMGGMCFVSFGGVVVLDHGAHFLLSFSKVDEWRVNGDVHE